MDRRISKTKLALKNSLIKLMQETNYKDISICDLCEDANLNRGTFYLHYKSIDELLKELENDFFSKLSKVITINYPVLNNDFRNLCNDIINLVKEDQDFLRALISKNGDYSFRRRLTRYTKEIALNLNKFEIAADDEQYLPFFITYMVEGGVGLLLEWISNGCQEDAMDIITRFQKVFSKIITY